MPKINFIGAIAIALVLFPHICRRIAAVYFSAAKAIALFRRTMINAVVTLITARFAAVVVTILLISVAPISHAHRLSESEFACRSKQTWDEIQSASFASQQAGTNKMRSFLAIGQCFWTTPGASCVIVDHSIWTGVSEVYVNDNGPYYMQGAKDKGCSFR